ncbi:PTS sugar transporter subunit IIA [Salipaludibacillus keqinensis]|uniref:Ascorbate-specific PTS system EIIA component n=1 Tax=Salipaludibacillus keqinensis TaxID=2045207 RepID=A0A323TCD3_9BACI|nr:PTS sugar transporter subunit IIA [Salipaludibacillus keqinensis]PYZ92659.1 PTS sugar transporter subunit IIA [Salipaludibacillus keqinensis]
MEEIKLDKQFIQWEKQADNWMDAIRISARPLLQEKKITTDYVEAMITNIKELGPYILIAPLVALPHARPEQGVNEIGLSVTVFQEPVFFDKPETGDSSEANIFICLAAKDSESHLDLLKKISSLIENEEMITKMRNTQSEEELHQIFA